MNLSDSSLPGAPLESRDPAQKELRTLVHCVAISVFIITGALFVFIYRQVVLVRRQTEELVHYLDEYNHSNAREFIGQMHQQFAEFRKKNPDFTPIYQRYFGTNEPPPAAATNSPSKVTPIKK